MSAFGAQNPLFHRFLRRPPASQIFPHFEKISSISESTSRQTKKNHKFGHCLFTVVSPKLMYPCSIKPDGLVKRGSFYYVKRVVFEEFESIGPKSEAEADSVVQTHGQTD